MDVESAFERLAGMVTNGTPHRITPRQLVAMVGAKRRGAVIVDEVRSRLARHKLETKPDFVEVGADEEVEVIPTADHEPPYVEPLTLAVQQLEADPSEPATTTVRSR